MTIIHMQERQPKQGTPVGDAAMTNQAQAVASRFKEDNQQAFYKLTYDLQTTLDLQQLLEIFYKHTCQFVPCDSLTYFNEGREIKTAFGTQQKHKCSYRLVIKEESIGQLIFSRARKFKPEETTVLESLLVSIVYPLRNALLYESALASAMNDPLTGIFNRAAMDTTLKQEIKHSERHGSPLSMIVFDIDHFKKINDSYGHSVGDCVLKMLANEVSDTIRESDMCFRYGGEEFTILLKNTNLDGATLLAERLRQKISTLVCYCEEVELNIQVSLGVANLNKGEDRRAFFDRCDKAMYNAKQSGRNQVKIAK